MVLVKTACRELPIAGERYVRVCIYVSPYVGGL